jgi:phage repressor protein C with HTH and peptisase S24 domain
VIADIETGRTRKPRGLVEIATALRVTVQELDPDRFAPRPQSGGIVPAAAFGGHGKDFPIFSAAEGGGGVMIVTFEPIDFTRRPAPLEHVKDSYGVYVVGESMSPAYEPGDVALVNPHLPPSPGRDAIFINSSDHKQEALIKRLVKASTKDWHVTQWNPRKEFTLARSSWPKCHIVVGRYGR